MSGHEDTNFGRHLASCEKEVREKVLEDVRSWMSCPPFDKIDEDGMMKLWVGLYMSMWMADKPLFQEKLAVNLASLVDCLSDSNEVFLFIGAFFKIIRREWSRIDRVRIDKFYMLIRTMLGRTLQYLQQQQWDECIIDQYLQLMSEALNTSTSALGDGITFHIVDVFLTELKKVSNSHLSKDIVVILLKPFVRLLATTPNSALRSAISDNVFEPLAVGIETGAVQKLSINPVAMSTEFLNLAKDATLPRSTANRKCLYQLNERFAKASDCGKHNGIANNKTQHTKNKKHKGKQADTSAKETGKKRHKQMPKDNKQLTNDISISSDISDTVPMDTTDNTISTCPSKSSDTIGDVTQLQVTKRPRKLRKRSLPAMSPSNNLALLDQNDGNSKAKKKRKSLDSRLEGGVNKKEAKKRYSLHNPSSSSESVLLLEDNGHANDHQRVIPSPLIRMTRSGKKYGRHLMKDPQLRLQPVVTNEQVTTSSSSKKVKFALQKNVSFDHQQTIQREFDHSVKPSKSLLKVSEHDTTTTTPPPCSKTITTRRKSSRFLKHS